MVIFIVKFVCVFMSLLKHEKSKKKKKKKKKKKNPLVNIRLQVQVHLVSSM